jgi:4-hydroxybenzoate polyprenyltransferase
MRPHQWSKNVLLFFPIVLAHRLHETSLVGTIVLATIVFSLMASAVYVLNDFFDVEADRKHPDKKSRPLAAGTVPLSWAPGLSIGLSLLSLALGFFCFPPSFGALLISYLIANLIYSSLLKQIPILDAVFLTLMFVLRICAGGLAGNIEVSVWLLTFSLFFFLSIAFAKRVQELQEASEASYSSEHTVRGYQTRDLPCISQLGISSGLLSVLVLALYMNSVDMIQEYTSPSYLWFLCPSILFWIGRIWLLTLRGDMLHDPILFVLKDKISYAVLAAVMIVVQVAYWL